MSSAPMKKVKIKPVYKKEVTELENGDKEVQLFVPDGKGGTRVVVYTEKKKVQIPKPTGKANNGLTIATIRANGHKVGVHHFRAYYSEQLNRPKTKSIHLGVQLVNVKPDKILFFPKNEIKNLRKDSDLTLKSTGGYTQLHITILDQKEIESFELDKIKEDERVEVKPGVWKRILKTVFSKSMCADSDHFCYKTGVKYSLDRLMKSDVEVLLTQSVAEPAEVETV